MLDRISEKLMHRSAEIENQIGLKLDILPAERNVVEVGPEQSIQQVHDRHWAAATLGYEPLRVRKRQHARSILLRQLGNATRCACSLRE